MLCTHWSGGASEVALRALYVRKKQTLDPDHHLILGDFKRDALDYTTIGPGQILLINQFACHKLNALFNKQKETGDVMQCVHNLQEHFDVLNDTPADVAPHIITINTRITASEVFVKYRHNLQVLSHMATYDKRHVYPKEDAKTLSTPMVHNTLKDICSGDAFFDGVITWDMTNIVVPMLNGFGNRRVHFGYNRGAIRLDPLTQTANPRTLSQTTAVAMALGPARVIALQACEHLNILRIYMRNIKKKCLISTVLSSKHTTS